MVLKLARVAGEAITYTQPGLQMRVEIVSVHRTGTRVLINGRPDTLRPGRPIALWPGVWIQMTGTSGRQVRIASAAPPEVVIMRAYYNEIDPYAAQWLRNLIAAGHIAPGDVDERSIEDVKPDDLNGYTQCHFFAGIGAWSLALRRAGWTDDRPVWTASCPCQPFSAAGAGAGFDDDRHLWPALAWLVYQRSPLCVFGEQVASKDADPWLDLVQADLEAMGYAFGAVPFPSAGIGAPHIRDRLYWVADAGSARSLPGALARVHRGEEGARSWDGEPERHRAVGGMADTSGARLAEQLRRPVERLQALGSGLTQGGGAGSLGTASPTNGIWRDADWLLCRDGKWRPVEPGTFPLAHGAPSRVGRLRAYGNAVNVEAATQFILAYLDA